MLVGYCVRRAGEPGPDPALAGVDGAPVRLVEDAGLGIWVSAGTAGDTRLPRLREHHAVVHAALASGTPLPLRFDTRLRDDDAARALLATRADEFREALERVAGRVEMGIRVGWADPPDEPVESGEVRSGTEFLEMRRREIRGREELRERAVALLDEVERHLAPMGLPVARTVVARAEGAGTLAHLVQRTDLTRYLRHVEEAGKSLRQARLRLSGPWAPYSFV